jgi:hypothetical protein
MKREREDIRKEFLEMAGKMFDSMLPPEGGFPDTTINEIEDRVVSEGKELERKLMEYRLDQEGEARQGELSNCPQCGKPMRIVEKGVRRGLTTTVGEVDYGRDYCTCDGCQAGFSPGG